MGHTPSTYDSSYFIASLAVKNICYLSTFHGDNKFKSAIRFLWSCNSSVILFHVGANSLSVIQDWLAVCLVVFVA